MVVKSCQGRRLRAAPLGSTRNDEGLLRRGADPQTRTWVHIYTAANTNLLCEPLAALSSAAVTGQLAIGTFKEAA